MARAPFTPIASVATGTVLSAATAVDAGNGNEFSNAARSIIEITNGSASAVTATFITNASYSTVGSAFAVDDVRVVVASSTSKVVGPFDTNLFNSATSTVQVDWSHGTSITARVIALGNP